MTFVLRSRSLFFSALLPIISDSQQWNHAQLNSICHDLDILDNRVTLTSIPISLQAIQAIRVCNPSIKCGYFMTRALGHSLLASRQ